ncbi:MAG: isoprenyl transferase [Bacillota bacterium]
MAGFDSFLNRKFRVKRAKDKWESQIDHNHLPQHIAVIMDGNGRWATLRGLPRYAGHRAGMSALKELVTICGELGIQVLTVYAFSTENWKRPAEEVSFLMNLLVEYMERELAELHHKGVQVRALGELAELPLLAQQALNKAENVTHGNQGMKFNIALNYGGRREILKAVHQIAQQVLAGEIKLEQINEELVSCFLYTRDLPDPDLVIRPSGEQRLSNFLLWQSAYSEFWTSSVLWPDFRKHHLFEAIVDYQKRHRRYGGL